MGEALGRIETDGDAHAVARIMMHAFAGGTLDETLAWVETVGREAWRVVREGPWVKACCFTTAMGVWLGGRRVSMSGVVGVGVAPEARGRGLATRLMEGVLDEQRAAGFALSGLFSAKQALYRRVGYEQAGHFVRYRVPMASLRVRRDLDLDTTHLRVCTLGDDDRGRVRDLYREVARGQDGMLDRGAYVWGRVERLRGEERHGFGFEDEHGRLEAYVYLAQHKDEQWRQTITIGDWQARSLRGWAALVRFLAEFSSLGRDVRFTGSPAHPALFVMDDQGFEVERLEYWMIRVLDPQRLLTERGYAPTLTGAANLRVHDDLYGTQDLVLRVSDGRGQVERGGSGSIAMDVRTLAAVASGFLSVPVARQMGLIHGETAPLEGLFSGQTPAMADQF